MLAAKRAGDKELAQYFAHEVTEAVERHLAALRLAR
jgi:hypothetical protein